MVAAVLGPALALCLVGARVWSGPVGAVLLAVVSGALWGLFAVLTKGVVDRLDVSSWAGLGELLGTPELYAWALVAVAGTAMQQASFRAGALTASLPTMTVTEPMVAGVLGVVVLGETLRPGDAGWFILIVAVAVMVAATAALARGEAPPANLPELRGGYLGGVLSAIAIVPSAPVMVPELAAAAAAETADLRDAALSAVGGAARRGGSRSGRRGRRQRLRAADSVGTFAGYGVDVPVGLSGPAAASGRAPVRLPLCALITGWLRGLAQPAGRAPRCGSTAADHDADAALTLRPGTARRDRRAPTTRSACWSSPTARTP